MHIVEIILILLIVVGSIEAIMYIERKEEESGEEMDRKKREEMGEKE